MAMKKFINDPMDLTSELLEGFGIAHGDKIAIQSEKLVVHKEMTLVLLQLIKHLTLIL